MPSRHARYRYTPAAGLPWMTLVLSTLCVLTRLVYASLPPLQQKAMVNIGGATPARVAEALQRPGALWSQPESISLLLGLFIHSSWLHLLGNLAYLWVFGLPVERRLGAVPLALTFLVGGAMTNLILALQLPHVQTPVIGASAAVSAVVGAYLGLFPGRRIGLYLPLGVYVQFARVPALLVIGSWFTLQLLYSVFGPISAAMAWWTHLGGFVLGLIFALLARALGQLNIARP